MKIVTGYTGTPHITSNDDQGLLQGIVGTGSYILSVGSQFAYTLISANELQISDGEGVLQGVHFRIEPGFTESVTIDNGSQGMQRIDLVCVRYEKVVDTGVESVSLVVHKGTPAAASPVSPTPVSGDILAGDLVAEMPLYTVTLNGLTVSNVSKVAGTSSTLSNLDSKIVFEETTITYSNGWTTINKPGHFLLALYAIREDSNYSISINKRSSAGGYILSSPNAGNTSQLVQAIWIRNT